MTQPTIGDPAPIDWRNLIRGAEKLLNPSATGDPPTAEDIRRAISNTYYALFHALAASNADALIGPATNPMAATAWTRVYRGLEHRTAERELRRHRNELSQEAQDFSDNFSFLQTRRHSADYDPRAVFTTQQTSVGLAVAEYVCGNFLRIDRTERTYIATITLIRGR